MGASWSPDRESCVGSEFFELPLAGGASIDGVFRRHHVRSNPILLIDPTGLEWEYSVGSGNITHVDDMTGARSSIGTGYAGNGVGLNNSSMQIFKNLGPLPYGLYSIGQQYDHKSLGPATMNLTPMVGTNTFGRDAFRIHGDNKSQNNSASEGCIVTNRATRDAINDSNDSTLRVVP